MNDELPLNNISIILPTYNEESIIGAILGEITTLYPDAEVIVVDDGSTDNTASIVQSIPGVRLIRHAYNIGNGAAVKTGIRAANNEIIVLMDADGQHHPQDIRRLVSYIDPYDMVVGARTDESEWKTHRLLANMLYNAIASYLVKRRVEDLTSGFRAIKTSLAQSYVGMLPNGFSYPTTLTLVLFRAGFTVRYEPIAAPARVGKSKIRLLYDGFGFLLTLARIGAAVAPMRIFLPLSLLLAGVGAGYSAFLLIFMSRFSNMAVLLILSGLMLFMLGLITEQNVLLRMSITDPQQHQTGDRAGLPPQT